MATRVALDMRREPGWVGREERLPVQLNGYARRADDQVFPVVIHDLSCDGCRIECTDRILEIGEWLSLDVAGLQSFRAQVRWSLLGSAGIRFED
ncbi:PilZ domain-containing protein [Sphingomonas piscis]|uniref:PilZ domain-containing protein n=1 Tax=Sphingomonas piscis TaxID=2714943 RepID=A0A6G7YR25_9SPHN|nr:PilZ domain-containing protein [Sphingomonas piscis]QIK79195.1 PilZ domain-containing protein [Sphingomonas piscis]